MPANALSDALEHLIETLVAMKIIAVWGDYTKNMWSEKLGIAKALVQHLEK